MLLLNVLGITGGIPFVLTASTLVVWLKETGYALPSLGLVSLLHFPYAFKFLWAPFFDSFSTPFFKTKAGRRRSWIMICQILMILGLFLLSEVPPGAFFLFFVAALWVSFWAANHDMLVAACQIDMVERKNWGMGEASTILGFRLGMMISGAGALSLSLFLPWEVVYKIMALLCLPGLLLTLLLPLTFFHQAPPSSNASRKNNFKEIVFKPFQDFMTQERWKTILIFMVIFRLQDSLIGVLPNIFFLHLGFSKGDISAVYKMFGMGMITAGGFLGGYFVRTVGYRKTLFWGALFHGLSSLTYVALGAFGNHLALFYAMVAFEELTRGFALTAFFAYQLTCCRARFAVTHLASLTATTTLGQSLIGSLSGFLAQFLGWTAFFLLTAFASLPALLMLKKIPLMRTKEAQTPLKAGS